MGGTVEVLPSARPTFKAASLRRPVVLRRGEARLSVDADSSVRSLESLSEGRLLFGREQLRLYKVQAGVVVQSPKLDLHVAASPHSAVFTGRAFEAVEVSQAIELLPRGSLGYVRSLRVRNSGTSSVKIRLIDVADPTAAHFGDGTAAWGSLGINVFNRNTHVAMDEVSDPPSARVMGSFPGPLRFFMTNEGAKAYDFLQRGELPDATAGMSGQTLVLSQHDLDLLPSDSKEVTFLVLYNPRKLEDALSEFTKLGQGTRSQPSPMPTFACSSARVSEAFAWACAAVESAEYIEDHLDRFETLRGLGYVEPAAANRVFEGARAMGNRDGYLPHPSNPRVPDLLGTCVLLGSSSRVLLLAGDKKRARAAYPFLRKLAGFLYLASKDNLLRPDPRVPQGWRRRPLTGYPSGEIPEVSLAAAGAMAEFSRLAALVAKPEDAGKFIEKSELVSEGVSRRLVDERGFLSLCVDPSGKMRTEETIDSAVAAYRHSGRPLGPSVVHRLLEKDFETPYGPRTVPTSNRTWFNSTYGHGQLGGFWTRAALCHASLSYASGLGGIGSLQIEKVARLVTEDAVKLGASPGDFPFWVDIEGREAKGEGSDPIAASRFIECLVEGELGFSAQGRELVFKPPDSSNLKWVLSSEVWTGEKSTIFIGRSGGKAHTFASCVRANVEGGAKFQKSEVLTPDQRDLRAVSFSSPGQVVCIGNTSAVPIRSRVAFPPRAAELAKRLSTPLEEYDPSTGGWRKIGALRVMPEMEIQVSVGACDWKSFRVCTA